MSVETWRKAGEFFLGESNSHVGAGPGGVKGGATATPSVGAYPLRRKTDSSKSQAEQILEAIAALAAGLTARDRQLSALSEQVRIHDKAQDMAHKALERIEAAIKGLESNLEAGLDTVDRHQLITLNIIRERLDAIESRQRVAAPKQKQLLTDYEQAIDYTDRCDCKSCKEWRGMTAKQREKAEKHWQARQRKGRRK